MPNISICYITSNITLFNEALTIDTAPILRTVETVDLKELILVAQGTAVVMLKYENKIILEYKGTDKLGYK